MNALALAIPQPENVQRRPKKTYATGVIRAFRNGNLPAHISRSIPGSTRSDWRRRDLSNIVGFVEPEFTDGFSNPLLHWHNRMAQRSEAALKIMIRFYQQVVLSVRGSKRIWREQKHRIVGLIERIAPIIGLDTACELLNLTQQRFYRWKNERPCNNDVFGRCGRAHPGRLTPAEQAVVKEYVTDEATKNWPLSNRFSKMMRDGAAFMNLQTFYRYARAFGPIFEQFKKPKHGVGVRASRPFEILHIDVTILRLRNGSRVFIQFIVDNFSRAILGWKAESFYYSGFTAENLRSVCEKFGLLRLPGNSKVLLV
ncbi:MAG: transposase, partial [Leptospiraceae bacterium]|nr:transposase [Leptospiraceae bacterium]